MHTCCSPHSCLHNPVVTLLDSLLTPWPCYHFLWEPLSCGCSLGLCSRLFDSQNFPALHPAPVPALDTLLRKLVASPDFQASSCLLCLDQVLQASALLFASLLQDLDDMPWCRARDLALLVVK